MSRWKVQHFLLGLYLLEFIALAVNPYDRGVWWAENTPVLMIVAGLVLLHRRFQFSANAYLLMSVFIFMHTVGGHYTFERVPFGWFSDLFGFERNHYDRVAHFSVGLFAFAICEYVELKRLSASHLFTCLFGVFAIFFIAAAYEIIEWWYAAFAAPESGTAFLGSQGDIWDAQKDMLADGLGSLCAVLLYATVNKRRGVPLAA